MKCKWKDCNNESRSKSPYCGGTCKKRDQRLSGTDVPVEVGQEPSGTQVGQGISHVDKVILKAFDVEQPIKQDITHEDAPRSTNAGSTIAKHRSRVGGCRVSIPGDEDYDGIVTKELAAERGWKLIV